MEQRRQCGLVPTSKNVTLAQNMEMLNLHVCLHARNHVFVGRAKHFRLRAVLPTVLPKLQLDTQFKCIDSRVVGDPKSVSQFAPPRTVCGSTSGADIHW